MLYSLIIVFFTGQGPEVFWGQETILFDSMAECERMKPVLIEETQKHHERFTVKGGCTLAVRLSDLKEPNAELSGPSSETDNLPATQK